MLSAEKIASFYPPSGCDHTDALPPMVQASLIRHRDNLAAMVAALEALGMPDDTIETHLSVVIGSYRAELSAALHHLGASA